MYTLLFTVATLLVLATYKASIDMKAKIKRRKFDINDFRQQ